MTDILTVEKLESIYGAEPALASSAKESTALTPEYRRLVEASPFLAPATAGPGCGQHVVIAPQRTSWPPPLEAPSRLDK